MRALDIPSYAAIGILESLWNLCAREAPQGNIGKLSDADIADQIGWDGKPDVLIAGLVDSGWLDRSEEHRVIVHDWRDHADDAVDNALTRSKLRYADGSIPRMNRLSKNERETAIAFYLQSVRTDSHKMPLPEPSQSPAGASAGATAAHKSAQPPEKPQRPLPPSPGANGEFMLAQELGKEIKLAMKAGDIHLVAQVIALEADEHGGVLEAKDFIRDRALEARARGEPVTLFWLQDRKFSQAGGLNGSNPSKSGQRFDDNRLAVAKALAKRGVRGPWSADGSDAATVAEPGRSGFDGRMADRPRNPEPEVLPPRG